MMTKLIFFWFALCLLVQAAFSLDCQDIQEQLACEQILNSQLSNQEKATLIANLDYKNQFSPNHEYVYAHNINLGYENIDETYDGKFIKNAWVKLLTAMPSVKYNENLYAPDNIKVLSAYDYNVKTPNNYFGNYPQTSQGDCKRIYSVIENNAENKVYVNDEYQGNGKLVDTNINSDSMIKTEYSINTAVDIDHYHWQRYCCGRTKSGCNWCYTCQYSHDETQTDNVVIKDNISVKHFQNSLHADVNVRDIYGSSKLGINYSNSIEINFQDSKYEYNQYSYDIDALNGVYTLNAQDYDQESYNNLIKNKDNLIVPNTKDCKIKAFDFFNSFEKECDLDYDKVDFNIKTDKLKYKPNETIIVNIYPENVFADITYDNITIRAKTNAIFIAKALANKITAKYQYQTSEAVIYVSNDMTLAIHLAMFGTLNVGLLYIAKQLGGAFL